MLAVLLNLRKTLLPSTYDQHLKVATLYMQREQRFGALTFRCIVVV